MYSWLWHWSDDLTRYSELPKWCLFIDDHQKDSWNLSHLAAKNVLCFLSLRLLEQSNFVSFSWHEKLFKFDFRNSISRMFTCVQCWHDFWHESVIVNLKFLNKLKQLTYTQKLAQRLFLFKYVRILNYTFILLLRKKNTIPRLMIAYFFSNALLLFLNPSMVVSPLFFNFELPVTHLMVTLSIMQPHPASDNPLIYTEQQRQRRQNSSNI